MTTGSICLEDENVTGSFALLRMTQHNIALDPVAELQDDKQMADQVRHDAVLTSQSFRSRRRGPCWPCHHSRGGP